MTSARDTGSPLSPAMRDDFELQRAQHRSSTSYTQMQAAALRRWLAIRGFRDLLQVTNPNLLTARLDMAMTVSLEG
jgi:hypothetical protein